MLKTVVKGILSLLLSVLFLMLSIFYVKGWMETNKRLNEVGYTLPTTFFKTWGYYIKENLWEDEFFD